jgi:hypothetical protein
MSSDESLGAISCAALADLRAESIVGEALAMLLISSCAVVSVDDERRFSKMKLTQTKSHSTNHEKIGSRRHHTPAPDCTALLEETIP